MKFSTCVAVIALVIASLISVVKAYDLNGRGIATIMDFGNATSSALDKRGKGRGTWYDGHHLKNAACYSRKGLPKYHASYSSMNGAMAMKKFENCYKCMKVTNNKDKKKSVVVKIVDKCGSCVVGKAIDLTPAAFKKLAPLKKGVLDISWKVVKCPSSIKPKRGPK